ncbi:FtsX-like permease family protein [Proteiniborus sp. MB09-C3]|uniref:ABC transporter permease n=1 Tax=Proteiniborus sp. MB09-C3 TaxID=3050072 RepID=UPI0025562CCA|nr:FtsX-like permease family protein [Proteiniborus sp. MB09-C3]WIV12433.1 FtsX-like permease family protein [Proteiniborus sp. MB09-C3]
MDYTKNNNNKVIHNLVKNSLKANRRRNLASILTIAFTVCVVLSLALTSLAVNQAKYDSVKNTYHVVVRNVKDTEIVGLSSDNRIQKAGVTYCLDATETPNGTVYFFYYNDDMLKSLSNLKGSAPIGENEIVVAQSYLDMIGQKADIGSTIQLGLGGNAAADFKITGILDDTEMRSDTFILFFSKAYSENFKGGESIDYNVYLWLKNIKHFSMHEAQETLTQVCRDNGIGTEQIGFNSPYFQYVGKIMDTATLLPIVLIGLFLLFAAAVVIYTIFYISVGGKIREYGRLRTIGATQKQIKRIVVYEGIILGAIGSVAGTLPGLAIGYALHPDGWSFVNTLLAILIVVLFSILIVWLSVRAPAKMAGNVSPVEAGRYSSYIGGKSVAKIKTGYKKSTPLRIAFLNVVRSPKKTALTILSLGLCGVLFLCAASLQKNITAENIVRSVGFQYGDYKLVVIGGEQASYSEIQQRNNPLTEELRNEILNISGVKNIHEWRAINGKITIDNTNVRNTSINLFGYAPQYEAKLSHALVDGTADYNELSRNNGVILNSPDTIKDIFGWEPKLGDMIELTTLAGNGEYVETTLVVMGITKNNDGFAELFRMTDASLQQITGTDCLDSWEVITAAPKDDTIKLQLTALIHGNSHLQLRTYLAALEEQKAANATGWSIIYILALLLGVFGIINLINTHMTNMISRGQEIGVLQAIGMTSKQLRASLVMEGFINTLMATMITILAGVPVGYMACTLADNSRTSIYNFPWQASLIYFIVLLAVQLFLIFYGVRTISKTPVIERMRNTA